MPDKYSNFWMTRKSVPARRKRNDAFYDIAMVSETEANEAVLTAEEYLQSVAADIHARLL
jgi:hypothetical protein